MSNSRWDDDSWRRSRSPRDGRAPEADRSHRGAPHGSSRGWDNGSGRDGSNGRERERPRGHDRDGGSSRGGWDEGRHGGGGSYERSSSRHRPSGRDEYDVARPGAGERSMRGPRPSSRDDGYGSPRHPRRPDGPPGASSSRGRPDRGGGLWGDDGARPRRHAPGARLDPRDPRLARRPLGAATSLEDDDEDESSFGLGKALGAILMMFALGAVAAFGYFRLSAPTVHTNNNGNNQQQSSTPSPSAAPSTTPSTTPSATSTPHAFAPASSEPTLAYVLVTRPMM